MQRWRNTGGDGWGVLDDHGELTVGTSTARAGLTTAHAIEDRVATYFESILPELRKLSSSPTLSETLLVGSLPPSSWRKAFTTEQAPAHHIPDDYPAAVVRGLRGRECSELSNDGPVEGAQLPPVEWQPGDDVYGVRIVPTAKLPQLRRARPR